MFSVLRKFCPVFLSVLILSCLAGPLPEAVSAQGAFEAYVDRNKVELGGVVELTIKVSGVQSASPPQMPAIDGLQITHVGSSTGMSIINNQYSGSVAFQYEVIPLKTGKFEIPAMTAVFKGEAYTTQPIIIEVEKPSGSSLNEHGPDAGQTLQDRLFMIMGTPRREVYLQEKVPLTIKVFSAGIPIQKSEYPQLMHDGVEVGEFDSAVRSQENIAGVMYDVIEFKTEISPTRPGEISFGPAKLKVLVLFDRPDRRRSLGGSGGLFDDDFFNSFISASVARAILLQSSDLKLRVLDFPEENKPSDFSGAVGRFNMEATVTPGEVKVGDPVTVRVKISGEGNLKSVIPPAFKAGEGIKVYDPQITEKDGAKVLEQVLIPTKDSLREVPAVSFSYFDTDAKQYRTVTRGPFPIKVEPAQAGEELKVVGLAQGVQPDSGRVESLGQDISFIKDRIGRLSPAGRGNDVEGLFFLALFWTMVWGVLVIVHHLRHRLRTDVRFARRLQAPREARKGLAKAREFLARGQQKEFYDLLFKTLQGYFGNKFHLPAGGVSVETMSGIVSRRGMKPAILAVLKDVFDECEMVRYASIEVNKEKMSVCFNRTAEIIDFFERNSL